MPINFVPDRAQILMCDFTTGFMRPEMEKIRHCVVVSPRVRSGTSLIIPLSLEPPKIVQLWHYLIPREYPCMSVISDVWAKGDMLTHASWQRLHRPKENHVEVRRILKPDHLIDLTKA